MKFLHVAIGPILFLVIQLIPIFGPPNARIGFGILFWMVYWWVTVAVDIKITVFDRYICSRRFNADYH